MPWMPIEEDRAVRASPYSLAGVALSAAIVAAWLGLFELAELLEYQRHASLWFPPVAITFATLFVLGWRGVPAIAASTVAATFLGADGASDQGSGAAIVQYALIFSLQHLAIWGGLAWLARRVSRERASRTSQLPVMTAFLLGGAGAALLSACIGSAGLVATGAIDLATMIQQATPWAIGDYAGLLALGPLAVAGLLYLCNVLRIEPARGVRHAATRMNTTAGTLPAYLWKLALLLGTTLAAMLLSAHLPQQPAVVFSLLVVVVLQLWIVHTHGTVHTLLAIAAFSLLIVLAASALGMGAQALPLQFAMISLAANSYFGLAAPRLHADNSRLRYALEHDIATGALSRTGFMEQAREQLRIAEASDLPVTLVLADLDGLKKINDRHGHASGDAALRGFVHRCRSRLQHGQLFGRLSGDEFALYLPHFTPARAQRLVDELRTALASPGDGDPYPGPLSASFGSAVRGGSGTTLKWLLAQADANMYEDKRRSRVARLLDHV